MFLHLKKDLAGYYNSLSGVLQLKRSISNE